MLLCPCSYLEQGHVLTKEFCFECSVSIFSVSVSFLFLNLKI